MTLYPTAAKAVAAIAFAALAWGVSEAVKLDLPPRTPAPFLAPVNAVVGFLMGWRISGRRAGAGYTAAIAIGLTSAAAITFWALLIWAGAEMLERAARLRYDGAMEALEATVELMLELTQYLTTPVIAGFAVGAAVIGLIVEWVVRRYG